MVASLWRHVAPLPSLRSLTTTAAAAAAPPPPPAPRRYAVVGGGFAGVAVAWHLLQRHSPVSTVALHLYDAHGLGAGGSGAAAGLLHPYTPRGKVLWRGLAAFNDALQLIEAAEAAAGPDAPRFAWRRGLLRPARSAKQARDFAKFIPQDEEAAAASCAACVPSFQRLQELVAGLDPGTLLPDGDAAAAEAAGATGLLTAGGVVLAPHEYLAAAWRACEAAAAGGGEAALRRRAVPSLAELDAAEGPYDAIIVAAGATVDTIAESAGRLPLDLCQGYSLEMQPAAGQAEAAGYPDAAPGLLGSPYISPQGSSRAIVGATQQHGASPAAAAAALGPAGLCERGGEEWAAAAAALLPPAARLWPPLGGGGWEVAAVRSGFRAIPQRTSAGAIPYAGRLEERRNWWVIGGLGARGLVYHAWLGRLVAAAATGGGEAGLPPELLRWKDGREGKAT